MFRVGEVAKHEKGQISTVRKLQSRRHERLEFVRAMDEWQTLKTPALLPLYDGNLTLSNSFDNDIELRTCISTKCPLALFNSDIKLIYEEHPFFIPHRWRAWASLLVLGPPQKQRSRDPHSVENRMNKQIKEKEYGRRTLTLLSVRQIEWIGEKPTKQSKQPKKQIRRIVGESRPWLKSSNNLFIFQI